MSPDLLTFALLSLLLDVGRSEPGDLLEVLVVSGSDCPLKCTARSEPGVQYQAVRWYKVVESPSSHLSGLLTKDLPNGTTRWYAGLDREVELLGESRHILLPNVTCSDAGVYICHLAAPVGEQNQEGQVLLSLSDCPTDGAMAYLTTDTYLVVFAIVVMMLALVIFLISYGSLKNILRDKIKTKTQETLLSAPLRPLEKRDLMLIYTLGPKTSKKSSMKHVCV